jgi:hypothetical protein
MIDTVVDGPVELNGVVAVLVGVVVTDGEVVAGVVVAGLDVLAELLVELVLELGVELVVLDEELEDVGALVEVILGVLLE